MPVDDKTNPNIPIIGETLIRGFRIEPDKVNEELDNFINKQCSWVTILDKIADQEKGILTIFLMGIKADSVKETFEEVTADAAKEKNKKDKKSSSTETQEGGGGSYTII